VPLTIRWDQAISAAFSLVGRATQTKRVAQICYERGDDRNTLSPIYSDEVERMRPDEHGLAANSDAGQSTTAEPAWQARSQVFPGARPTPYCSASSCELGVEIREWAFRWANAGHFGSLVATEKSCPCVVHCHGASRPMAPCAFGP
jgi:hypothetical protein